MHYNNVIVDSNSRIYRPVIQSRRSEIVAWGLAIASLAGLLILNLGGMIFFWASVFVVFIFFAALSISLGNWMDRNTQITIDDTGIIYKNGLRNLQLGWMAITSVETNPARWGEKVQVIAAKSHFDFNTLGEVVFQDKIQGQVGFKDGKEILEVIVMKSGLTSVAKKGNSYYYSRP